MGFIDNVAPSASDMPAELAGGKEVICDPAGAVRLFTFKTLVEPHLGRLVFFKVLSGEVCSGMELTNDQTGATERISQMFMADGKQRQDRKRGVKGKSGEG